MKRNKPENETSPLHDKNVKTENGTLARPWGLVGGKAGTLLPACHSEQTPSSMKNERNPLHLPVTGIKE